MAGKRKKVTINSRMQKIMDGELSIEDLDDEEIFSGKIRATDGSMKGRPVDFIPRKFYAAATAELMKRFQLRVNEQLEPMLQVLQEIALNTRLPADARYKAATYLVERAAGKVPDKVEAQISVQPWQQAIEGIVFDDEEK